MNFFKSLIFLNFPQFVSIPVMLLYTCLNFRYCLAVGSSAESAKNALGELIATKAADSSKYKFIICDTSEAWWVSSTAQSWNGKQLTEAAYSAVKDADEREISPWTAGVGQDFNLKNMFETLRENSNNSPNRSANISVLKPSGISCHWFTGTPNAQESVFKPFVFSSAPKISPLTKVPAGQEVTLLHKLHAQRKDNSMEKLKNLESTCVAEMEAYFGEHTQPDDELDELLKDCVEAEVKFYR